ncbi:MULTISPECIES: hypothetical protein [Vibrio]|uniref:hypothetical protein n=1 Tax=Vibrio TaxID=662 RepID=UPI00031DBB8E|nr:hypothetical protein [Vibrio splendidus]OEE54321.1 hypothetical protein A146_14650 [Vibrio splendidus FF-500]
MVHNRTCGCRNCFEINYPDRPNPHIRSFGYRAKKSSPKVTHVALENEKPYGWLEKESVTFCTECWWCGAPVYFHRNINGGCVLFDSLGSPWAVHDCWEKHREQKTEAIHELVAKRIAQLQDTGVKGIEFSKANENLIQGFIISVDRSRKILPDPSRMSDKSLRLVYVVFKTVSGEYLKLFAPESYVEDITKFSYVHLTIEFVRKNNELVLNCIRKLTEIRGVDMDGKELQINYDYQSITAKPWTIQSK